MLVTSQRLKIRKPLESLTKIVLGAKLKELLSTKNWSSEPKIDPIVLYSLVTFSQLFITLVQHVGNWEMMFLNS